MIRFPFNPALAVLGALHVTPMHHASTEYWGITPCLPQHGPRFSLITLQKLSLCFEHLGFCLLAMPNAVAIGKTKELLQQLLADDGPSSSKAALLSQKKGIRNALLKPREFANF
ncbi:hypothetical protein VTK26DRAFT_182 [Humicola hyalothermophila]